MQLQELPLAILLFAAFLIPVWSEQVDGFRYIMYLTGQHNVVPEPPLVSEITHVALAFMRSNIFNENEPPSVWPLFTSVEAVRNQFPSNTKVMVAIGGWGDTEGFSQAASTEASRRRFARNIHLMVEATGADGVDIDWEYPGGNGEDYKQVPNVQKAWEIDAYPELLKEIRSAVGPDKLLSAAVPGMPRDMISFTNVTIPKINEAMDFLNVMTYDLMNRRDNITKHHTGVEASTQAIEAYRQNGFPVEKLNLGFAFYTKWYRTQPTEDCTVQPIGCPTTLMEDPVTGADLGQTGSFSWHDSVPLEVKDSYVKAMAYGQYDDVQGGHYYLDLEEKYWWSWDTPEAIRKKFPKIVRPWNLGGVFAWGLGEDAEDFIHLKALTKSVVAHSRHGSRDEL